jgi:hypothetical protein
VTGIIIGAFAAAIVLGLAGERLWRGFGSMKQKVRSSASAFLAKLRWIVVTGVILAAVMLSVYKADNA